MQIGYLYNSDQTPVMDTIHGWGERFRVPATLYLDEHVAAGDVRQVYSAGRGEHDYVVVDADERTALLVRSF